MKILVAGHALVVNANRQLWNELGTLTDEVDVIVPKSWKSNLIKFLTYKYDEKCDGAFQNIFPVRCFLRGRASFFIFNPLSLLKIFNKKKYDAILLTQETWSLVLLEFMILRFFSINRNAKFFILASQNLKKDNLFFLRFFERFNTSTVSSILCCCEEVADVIEWKGINKECKYIPFSINEKDYSQDLTDIPKRGNKSIVLGYLGRISEEKGIELIIELLERLKDKGVNVKLIAGGAGPLEHLFQNNPLVEFRGIIPHSEAYKFYQDIDAFIMPSQTRSFWKEQFGRVIIESVAANRPVIGSDSGSIPEVMGRISMPYIFKEDSVDDFEKTVMQVIEDISNDKIMPIVRNSREKTFELCTHTQVAKRFLSYAKGEGKYNDLRR